MRERSPETVARYAAELIRNNGFDEISLSSLSTCDYPYLKELLQKIKPLADENHVTIALPSTRVDSFEAEFVAQSRLGSITFAPEAGTQRLRDVINKNVTEDDIFTCMRYAFEKGYSSVKLYFMIGLPTETQADIEGIVDLAARIRSCYRRYKTNQKPLRISLSTSTFVPKPFTPFQWERQIGLDEIAAKQTYLKQALRPMGIKYNWHDSKTSRIEATLARGDAAMGKVLLHAYRHGCRYDSWNEYFDYDKWEQAFVSAGIDMARYTEQLSDSEPLPWEFIQAGVSRDFLLKEREKAYRGELTEDCRGNCKNCGIQKVYPAAFANNCARGQKK